MNTNEMNLPVNDCGQKALILQAETGHDFYLESCAPGEEKQNERFLLSWNYQDNHMALIKTIVNAQIRLAWYVTAPA